MRKQGDRKLGRRRRHLRVRRKVVGSAERPRLCVYKSLRHIYAQLIDDAAGSTLAAASTLEKEVAKGLESTADAAAAKAVGEAIAQRAQAQGIESVVFDRSGYLYHGKVKVLAEAAREGGLRF
ncbi:MAG: 50S ribosomal protein L18 [Armatimonadota bacterium]